MPKQVKIPFHREMIRATFDGNKDRTSRTKRLGNTGDWFVLNHPDTKERRVYEIIVVIPEKLGFVAENLYIQEGFRSPDEFRDFIKKIWYGRPFNPDRDVFVHMYKEKKADDEQKTQK